MPTMRSLFAKILSAPFPADNTDNASGGTASAPSAQAASLGDLNTAASSRIFGNIPRISGRWTGEFYPHEDRRVSDLLFPGYPEHVCIFLPLSFPHPVPHARTSWAHWLIKAGLPLTSNTHIRDIHEACPEQFGVIHESEGHCFDRRWTQSFIECLWGEISEDEDLICLSWEGYCGWYGDPCPPPITATPENSFLEGRTYHTHTWTLPRLARHLYAGEHFPCLILPKDLSFIITQPIYSDRFFVSCSVGLARKLKK